MTVTGKDLLFDSDFGQGPVHSKGSVVFQSNINQINYGKTFVNMPMIMFSCVETTGPNDYIGLYINDFVLSASPTNASAWVRVNASNFQYSGPLKQGMVMKYIIWDLDL